MRAIEIMGSLSNVAPVFDHINMDKLVRHLADIVGVPQKILKPQSELNAERQQAQATTTTNATDATTTTSSRSRRKNSTISKGFTRRS